MAVPEGRATLQDVAERARVSTATVSRVLNGGYPVAAETRRRVEKAVRALGYVANAHARALAGVTNRTVGVVVTEIVDPFFSQIVHGIQRETAAAGRICLIGATLGEQRRELEIVDLLHEQRAEAVIVVGGALLDERHQAGLAADAKAMAASGSRLVLCGRPPLPAPSPSAAVHYDNTNGALNAVDHLMGLGHRRILYVGGRPDISTQRDRLAGYLLGHERRGLEADPGLVLEGEFSRRFGYERTAQALERLTGAQSFTAVMAANDATAAGAMQALREAGRRVPQDVSVVGYDDVPVAAETVPALTTVHIPLQEMGRAAVRLALGGEQGGSGDYWSADGTLVLGTHLVLRGSTAPAPSARSSTRS